MQNNIIAKKKKKIKFANKQIMFVNKRVLNRHWF